MKKGAAIAVGIGAGLAALWAANKAGAFGDVAEAGSLGGSDEPESLTAEGNPFARIDPNYQYPTDQQPIVNQFFMQDPADGSVTPMGATGSVDNYDGSDGPGSGDTTGGEDPGAGGAGTPGGTPWYNTGWGQVGLFIGADAAIAGGAFAGKKAYNAWRARQLGGKAALKTEKGLSRSGIKTADLAADAGRAGKAQDVAEMSRLAAKGTKVGDATADATRVVRAVEPSGNALIDATRTARVTATGTEVGRASRLATTGGRIASTGGKLLGAAGGLVDTALVGYNIYDMQREYKPEGFKESAGVTTAAVIKSGEQTVDPFFSLVYRPKRVADDIDYKETGWFAGFRESAWTELAGVFKPQPAAAPVSLNTQSSVAPGTLTEKTIAAVSGSNRRVTAPVITGSSVLHTGSSVAQTTQSVQQLKSQGYNNAQIVNMLSAPAPSKSGGGSSSSSKSSSSSSKSVIGAKVGTVFKSGAKVKSSGASGKYRKY